MLLVVTPPLFGLSVLSGMLKDVIQPRALLLNGLTALKRGARFLVIITRFTEGKVKSATLSRILAIAVIALPAQRTRILLI